MAKATALKGEATRSRAVLAWLRLARVYQKVDQASAAHLRRWGLSVAQFDVLAHVGAAPGVTQQALAASLLVTKGNICQLLDRLEAGGLMVRRREGRSNRLYLTDEGAALFRQTVPAQEALVARLLGALAPPELATLHGLLRRLDRALAAPLADGRGAHRGGQEHQEGRA